MPQVYNCRWLHYITLDPIRVSIWTQPLIRFDVLPWPVSFDIPKGQNSFKVIRPILVSTWHIILLNFRCLLGFCSFDMALSLPHRKFEYIKGNSSQPHRMFLFSGMSKVVELIHVESNSTDPIEAVSFDVQVIFTGNELQVRSQAHDLGHRCTTRVVTTRSLRPTLVQAMFRLGFVTSEA
jgi:hypothetical protein